MLQTDYVIGSPLNHQDPFIQRHGSQLTANEPPREKRGWSGGAMVLGKLPVPGRPTILITVGQGPIALAVGAGGGGLDIFTLIYLLSPLSLSFWETARYRLKYCLKGPLNPKPTNQPTREKMSKHPPPAPTARATALALL